MLPGAVACGIGNPFDPAGPVISEPHLGISPLQYPLDHSVGKILQLKQDAVVSANLQKVQLLVVEIGLFQAVGPRDGFQQPCLPHIVQCGGFIRRIYDSDRPAMRIIGESCKTAGGIGQQDQTAAGIEFGNRFSPERIRRFHLLAVGAPMHNGGGSEDIRVAHP